MGAMTRAEYRGLAQAQQRLIIERLQETAEAMNSLFPWEVRVAVCRKCRVPAIVEVQESEREVTPYWQRADDDIGPAFRKPHKPYYCLDCRGAK